MQTREIIQKVIILPEDPSDSIIKSTAGELKMLNFAPILLIDTPGLLYMKKTDIIGEIGQIDILHNQELPEYDKQSFSSPEDFKEKHFDLLYFYYELIGRLRHGEPEAWDYIHELYEDD